MDTTDHYLRMANTLDMFRSDLCDLKEEWKEIENKSWHVSCLEPSLAILARDLDSIRAYVDSSQEEIRELRDEVRNREHRRDELLTGSRQKMQELKTLQWELKNAVEHCKKNGMRMKEIKENMQQLTECCRNIKREQRQINMASKMEAVVFAHCTRLAEPKLKPETVYYQFKPLDLDQENDFVGKKYEYRQNWEELGMYHGIDMTKYSGRPKTRSKRNAPAGLPPVPDSKVSKKRSSLIV